MNTPGVSYIEMKQEKPNDKGESSLYDVDTKLRIFKSNHGK